MKIKIDYNKDPEKYNDAKQVIYFIDVDELISTENIIGKTILSFSHEPNTNALIIELGELDDIKSKM